MLGVVCPCRPTWKHSTFPVSQEPHLWTAQLGCPGLWPPSGRCWQETGGPEEEEGDVYPSDPSPPGLSLVAVSGFLYLKPWLLSSFLTVIDFAGFQ